MMSLFLYVHSFSRGSCTINFVFTSFSPLQRGLQLEEFSRLSFKDENSRLGR